MTEENLVLNNTDSLGEIVIAPQVIEIIIGIAASKVEGVVGMQGSLAKNIAEKFGRQSQGKGVDLTTNEDESLSVDLYLYFAYGISVPKVAIEIQEKVKQQVLYMTGIELAEINVHIVAILPEKETKTELSDLLNEEGNSVDE